MQKSPASAPEKLERPFVATSTVWVRDTLQAWEGYAISRHSAKSLHERPMNAMIFVLQGFLSLKLITNLWIFLPQNDTPQKTFYGPQVFRLI